MIRISGPGITVKDFTKTPHETKMFFRCTTLEYAEKFIKTGNIRFGLPKEWIDTYIKEGDGRGDLLEGCYGCLPEFNLAAANFYMGIRPNAETFRDKRNDYLYFRSKNVLNMRTFCLFGLDRYDFKKVYSKREDKLVWQYRLPKQYFEDFSPITKDDYDSLPPNEKPVLLMISDPSEFVKRLRTALNKMDIRDEDWVIHPIGYSDKKCKYLIGDDIPAELFSKDTSFEYQKEIRAVIYGNRPSIIKKMNKCNGIIDLGAMDDIAMIQEYYFDDMVMQLENEKSMLYTLPREIVTPLDELDKETLLGIIQQAYENRIPGCDLDKDEDCAAYIVPLSKVLLEKYHIESMLNEREFRNIITGEMIKIQLK